MDRYDEYNESAWQLQEVIKQMKFLAMENEQIGYCALSNSQPLSLYLEGFCKTRHGDQRRIRWTYRV